MRAALARVDRLSRAGGPATGTIAPKQHAELRALEGTSGSALMLGHASFDNI